MEQDLQNQINELRRDVQSLRSGAEIPHDVEQALRQRLRLGSIPVISVSAKAADSENKAVNEAGAASYNVLNTPNGFVEYTPPGSSSIIYIPYFT